MIDVRITYSDSGTGESATIDRTIPELTGEELRKMMQILAEENEDNDLVFKLESFVVIGDEAAFIMSTYDDYFCNVLWTGIVYTSFVK